MVVAARFGIQSFMTKSMTALFLVWAMVHLGIEIIEMLGKVIISFCHLLLL